MIFRLTAYDTEQRNNRALIYTSSEKKAAAWEELEKIQFADSGHGIVFLVEKIARRDLLPFNKISIRWNGSGWEK